MAALEKLKRKYGATIQEVLAFRDEVAKELWQIALLMEEGDLNDAKERLKRAQDRLSEAIKRGASSEETQELMDEMRQAMDDYMDMLAENMDERTPEEQSADGGATMSEDQLQEMLDRLQKLMDEGKAPKATIFIDSPLASKATAIFVKHAGELQHGSDLTRAFRCLSQTCGRWGNRQRPTRLE